MRKVQKMIEELERKNEGAQVPKTVAVLKEIDERLAKLEKPAQKNKK